MQAINLMRQAVGRSIELTVHRDKNGKPTMLVTAGALTKGQAKRLEEVWPAVETDPALTTITL